MFAFHTRGPRCAFFGVSTRGGLVRAGCLGGRCKFSCMVSSVRVARRWLTTFHREVTAFGGTYPGSWLSGAWQDSQLMFEHALCRRVGLVRGHLGRSWHLLMKMS